MGIIESIDRFLQRRSHPPEFNGHLESTLKQQREVNQRELELEVLRIRLKSIKKELGANG